MFRTTNMDYGAKRPNVHTMPTVYNSKSSGFTGVCLFNLSLIMRFKRFFNDYLTLSIWVRLACLEIKA